MKTIRVLRFIISTWLALMAYAILFTTHKGYSFLSTVASGPEDGAKSSNVSSFHRSSKRSSRVITPPTAIIVLCDINSNECTPKNYGSEHVSPKTSVWVFRSSPQEGNHSSRHKVLNYPPNSESSSTSYASRLRHAVKAWVQSNDDDSEIAVFMSSTFKLVGSGAVEMLSARLEKEQQSSTTLLGCTTVTSDGMILQSGMEAFVDSNEEVLGVHVLYGYSTGDKRLLRDDEDGDGVAESKTLSIDARCFCGTRRSLREVFIPEDDHSTSSGIAQAIAHHADSARMLEDACEGMWESELVLEGLSRCFSTLDEITMGNDVLYSPLKSQSTAMHETLTELKVSLDNKCADLGKHVFMSNDDVVQHTKRFPMYKTLLLTHDRMKGMLFLHNKAAGPQVYQNSHSVDGKVSSAGEINALNAQFQNSFSGTSAQEQEDARQREAYLRATKNKVMLEFIPSLSMAYTRVDRLLSVVKNTVKYLKDVRNDGTDLGWWLCLSNNPVTTCRVSGSLVAVLQQSATVGSKAVASFMIPKAIAKLERFPIAQQPIVPTTRVVWTGWCCNCCGFSTEMAHIIPALSRRIPTYTTLDPTCFCAGAPAWTEDALRRMVATESALSLLHNATNHDNLVWISHTDPLSLNDVQLKKDVTHIVARSMYEFSRIPPSWVVACNAPYVDEIWVPSKFVQNVFVESGVTKSIVVVPEATDPYVLDPDLYTPFDTFNTSWRYATNDVGDHTQLFQGKHSTSTKFLSVFKWEARKGWDHLFEAYFEEFTAKDNVTLFIVTHIWFPTLSLAQRNDPNNASAVMEIIINRFPTYFEHPETLPRFVIITEPVDDVTLRRLYRTMNVFVLPTKGEGWCLPAMEAMSMALPVITTRWSGVLDFASDGNAYLIDVATLELVPSDTPYHHVEGAQWAVPSVSHLQKLMRHVVHNPLEAWGKGQSGRMTILEHFTEENVARKIEGHIRRLIQKKKN
eukprot:PhF_6_TR26216/c0_g1_i3/m.37368